MDRVAAIQTPGASGALRMLGRIFTMYFMWFFSIYIYW
jgi:aspartate/tyrosine/aromatic aminotransferase